MKRGSVEINVSKANADKIWNPVTSKLLKKSSRVEIIFSFEFTKRLIKIDKPQPAEIINKIQEPVANVVVIWKLKK